MNKERLPFIVLLVCGACLIALGVSLVVPITDTLSPLPSKGDGKTIIPPSGTGRFNFNVTYPYVFERDVFAIDLKSFRYYNVSDGRIELPGAQSAIVPWNCTIGFSLNVTNLQRTGQNITLDSKCALYIIGSHTGNVTYLQWSISNVDTATGSISPTYAPITLVHNVTQELFFCRQPSTSLLPSLKRNRILPLNALMFGTRFGDNGFHDEYGENIPLFPIYAKA